MNEYWEKS